jgi:hypothetical protein
VSGTWFRAQPGTWRGYEAGRDGLEVLVFGAPNLDEIPRDDVEGRRDCWADQVPGEHKPGEHNVRGSNRLGHVTKALTTAVFRVCVSTYLH